MSSGSLIIGNLTTTSSISSYGDVSLDTRLFLGGDASMGGRLFVKGDSSLTGNVTIGKNLTVVGNLVVQEYTNTNIINTITTNVFDISEDLSLNGRFFTSGDASFGGNVYVRRGLTVAGPVSIPSNSIPTTAITGISSYATLSGSTFSGPVVATNGLAVTGPISIPSNSIPTTSIAGISAYSTLAGSTFTGSIFGTSLNTSSTITSAGLVTANNGLTVIGAVNVPANSIPTSAITGISSYATLAGSTFTAPVYGTTLNTASTITSAGLVTANGGLTVVGSVNVPSNSIPTTAITGISAYATLAGSSFTGAVYGTTLNTTSTITSAGLVTANNGLTVVGAVNVPANSIPTTAITGISAYATLAGSTFTAPIYGTTLNTSSTITSSGLVMASNGLTVNGSISIPSNSIPNSAISGINAYATLAGSSFTAPVFGTTLSTTSTITSAGLISANNGLTVLGSVSVPANSIPTTAITGISAYATLAGSTFSGLVIANNGLTVTGPVSLPANSIPTTVINGINAYATLAGSTFTAPVYGTTLNTSSAITSAGLISANNGLTVVGSVSVPTNSIPTTAINGINAYATLAGSSFTAPVFGTTLSTTSTITSAGLVTANNGLTVVGAVNVPSNSIPTTAINGISAYATLSGSTFTGGVYGTTLATSSTVTSAGLVTANNGLTVVGAVNIPTNSIPTTAITGISAYATLAGSTFTGPVYTPAIISSGLHTANAGLSVVGSDATLGGRLFVSLDSNMTGNLTVGKDLTLLGNLIVKDYTNNNIVNTITTNVFSISEDLSLNGRIFTSGDASFGRNVTVSNLFTSKNGLTVTGPISIPSNSIPTTAITGISAYATLAGSTFTAPVYGTTLNTSSTITSAGLITANNGLNVVGSVTFPPSSITPGSIVGISSYATLAGSTFTAPVYGTTLNTSSAITSAGLVTANNGLTVVGAVNVPNNSISTSAINGISAYATLAGSNFTGAISGTSLSTSSTITSGGLVTANNGLTVYGTSTFTGAISGTSLSTSSAITSAGLVTANNGLTVYGTSNFNASVTANNGLTVYGTSTLSGSINANGGLSVLGTVSFPDNSISTTAINGISAYATLGGSTFTAPVYGTTLNTSSAITSAGLVTANKGLTVLGSVNVPANSIPTAAITGISAYATLAGSTFTGPVYTPALISSGLHTANAGLTVVGQVNVPANSIPTAAITGISAYATLAGSTFTGLVLANNGLTVVGQVNVPANSIPTAAITGISAYATLAGSTFTAPIYGTTLNTSSAITSAGLVTANNGLTVLGTVNVPNNSISTSAINGISAYATLAGSNFTGAISGTSLSTSSTITSAGLITANAGLAVYATSNFNATTNFNASVSGTSLSTSSTITSAGLITANNGLTVAGTSTLSGSVNVTGGLSVNGSVSVPNNSIPTTAISGISSYATLAGSTFTAPVYGTTLNTSSAITAAGLVTANNGLTVLGSVNVPANSIPTAAISGIGAYATLAGSTFTGTVFTPALISNGLNTANAGLVVSGSDTSLNGRLFVLLDTAMNGNVTVGKDLTILGNLTVKQATANNIINTITTNVFNISEDLSLNGRIFTSGDASLNRRLFVGSDITLGGNINIGGNINVSAIGTHSINGTLTTTSSITATSIVAGNETISGSETIGGGLFVTGGDSSFNNRLFVIGDTSLNGRLFVNKDLLLNGNLSVVGSVNFPFASISASAIAGGVQTNGMDLSTNQTVNGIKTFNGILAATSDASFNGRFLLGGDASMNGRLFINNNLSLNGNLSVGGSVNFQAGSISASAIAGGVQTNGMDLSTNQTINGIKTFAGILAATSDVSLNGNVYIGKTTIHAGDTSANGRLFLTGDASLGGRLFINKDLSLIGNLSVGGSITFPTGSIPSSAIQGGVQTNGMDLSTNQTVNGIKTFNGILTATSDASFNGRFFLGGDASLNGRLFIARDLSVNGNLSANNFVFMNSSTYSNTANNSTVKMSLAPVVSNQLDLSGSFSINTALGIGTNNPQFQLDVGSGGVGCGRVVQFGNGSSVISSGVNTTVFASNFTTDASVNGNLIVGGNVNLTSGVTRVSRIGEKVYPNNTAVTTAYTFDVAVSGTIMNLTAGAQTANYAINLINIPSDLNQTFTVTILSTGNFYCSSVSTSTTSVVGATTVAATPKWIGASAPSISGASYVMQSITIINNNTTVSSAILSSANAYA